MTPTNLTQRERNRLQEHRDHTLVEGMANVTPVVGGVRYGVGAARLYTCSCGWMGWMRAGLL